MKFCKECGKEMFDDAMVCPNCGTYQTELTKAEEPGLEEPSIDVQPEVINAQDSQTQYGQSDSYSYGIQPQHTYNYGQPNPSGAAYTYGSQEGDSRFNIPTGGSSYPIQKYSFWKFLLLTMITCGIYGLYYMYKWTEDTNRLSQGVYKPSMNYLLVFLLGLVTCGIYPLIWTYQQGERLKVVGDANGIKINETGVHHLLITLLLGSIGGIISTCIFFSNTNRLSGVYNGTMTRDQANQKTSHVPVIIVGVVLAILFGAITLGAVIFSLRNSNFDNYNNAIYDFNDLDDFDWDMDDFDDDYAATFGSDATFDGAVVQIMDAVKIQDANGDPALAVTFSWENMGHEKSSAMWEFYIEATQDGSALETTWPKNGDPNVTEMENYSKNIEGGESTTFQVVFKLVNESDDVQVIVEKLLSGDGNKACCIFTL